MHLAKPIEPRILVLTVASAVGRKMLIHCLNPDQLVEKRNMPRESHSVGSAS